MSFKMIDTFTWANCDGHGINRRARVEYHLGTPPSKSWISACVGQNDMHLLVMKQQSNTKLPLWRLPWQHIYNLLDVEVIGETLFSIW